MSFCLENNREQEIRLSPFEDNNIRVVSPKPSDPIKPMDSTKPNE